MFVCYLSYDMTSQINSRYSTFHTITFPNVPIRRQKINLDRTNERTGRCNYYISRRVTGKRVIRVKKFSGWLRRSFCNNVRLASIRYATTHVVSFSRSLLYFEFFSLPFFSMLFYLLIFSPLCFLYIRNAHFVSDTVSKLKTKLAISRSH